MKRDTFIIGFMLFALFFGAGNLIYPPTLGIEAGSSYLPAIIGFILTGVGLPILAVAAVSFVKNDARELADHVHPLFGLIFTSLVYLAIGPFFGIPRASTVAFEMTFQPFTDGSSLLLFIFTTIFFILVFLVALNPSKLVDRIGQWLTPVLLLAIVVLCIGSITLADQTTGQASGDYAAAPFFKGFVEGYLTMDAIAALAFGIIVVNAFKDRGITSRPGLIKATLKAGAVAGIGLVAVYSFIGWIGTKMNTAGQFSNGGDILSSAADMVFGPSGALILGIIVALACFTTSVGLVVACGQFFYKITNFSYKSIIAIVTITSYLIANLGLETIISVSVPVLTFIYPIAIVLIILTFINKWFKGSPMVYRGAILMTAVFALYDGLSEFGINMPVIKDILAYLPLFSVGLGWLIPAMIGGIIGYFIKDESSESDAA